MAKFYMAEFIDKVTSKKFYKFGWTNHNDALKRFEDSSYSDFDIKILASVYGTQDEVKLIECVFLSLYPKNLWLETYLGDDRKWDGFSGITEIVNLSDDQYSQALGAIYRIKQRRTNSQ